MKTRLASWFPWSRLASRHLAFAVAAVISSSVASRADILYVGSGDFGLGSIFKVTSDGTATTFATTDLERPYGLAFDSAGLLYAGNNAASGFVSRFTPVGASSLFTDGSEGLSWTQGLAFDGTGDLYVANDGSGTITRITPGGVDSIFANVPRPWGLAFHPGGDLFVSTFTNDNIYRITPSGSVTLFADADDGLFSTRQLAFDHAGDLFVANGDQSILRFTPDGIGSVFADATDGLSDLTALAFDSAGLLYVGNYGNDNILRFTPDGSGSVFATGILQPLSLALTDDAGVPLPLPVPEPSTVATLLGGIALLLGRRRARQS